MTKGCILQLLVAFALKTASVHMSTRFREHTHTEQCKVSSHLHTSDSRKFRKIMVLFSTSKSDKSHNKEDTLLLWVFLQNETVSKMSRYHFDWQVSILNGHFTQMFAFVVVISFSLITCFFFKKKQVLLGPNITHPFHLTWTGYLTAVRHVQWHFCDLPLFRNVWKITLLQRCKRLAILEGFF